MTDKNIEYLIKESLKDIALRLDELNYDDRNSLLAEYREWIEHDLNLDLILMLPYEAYTYKFKQEFKED
tara:strand:- start:1057 stop:1263 length:207 start_codon:yes stop_codon:yes gene_type:complete